MYKVAVIGASGFVGIETVRLLLAHPAFEPVAISSNADVGKTLGEVYPFFTGRTDLVFEKHETVLKNAAEKYQLAFLTVPHTAALELVPELLKQGVSVVDLSADFRLKEAATYEAWYGLTHTAQEFLAQAVYGLPEVYRGELTALANQRVSEQLPALVSNPGCYPTASVLAALPLLKSALTDADDVVVINAISGVSGAGKKLTETTNYCLANENLNAYGAVTHRHTPEIAQTLSHLAGHTVSVQFTPHLAPLSRGMVSTVTMRLSKEAAKTATAKTIYQLYEDAYAGEAFVHLMAPGTMPKSSHVKYSNYAHVGVAYDPSTRMVIASCALDNIGKGAASQAIQNANILFSLDENTGLAHEGGIL
ncbi:MAG: N-acetyl-gamma-glutamyl-phosphate reductase [Coriobacteriales bacterium]|jgi:N-acetyl-gamma-glutamyl-phosphate reductase|nr:N-acetyl-gamma-glutamyl-phosphate reductase [Coriobacteriales bacterium]